MPGVQWSLICLSQLDNTESGATARKINHEQSIISKINSPIKVVLEKLGLLSFFVAVISEIMVRVFPYSTHLLAPTTTGSAMNPPSPIRMHSLSVLSGD